VRAALALVFVAAAAGCGGGGAASGELDVTHATLTPGRIALVLVNDSEEAARVQQVILNDAFVDFRASQQALEPGDAERITVRYPWIEGESYELELLTSTGATVEYEIEEAEAV
jgi:ZIP family zinc transporter